MTTAADARTCPVCTQPLASAEHEGIRIDRCSAGCGVWLDRGELRAAVESERVDRSEAQERAAVAAAAADGVAAVAAEIGRARRACPVCAGALALVEYPGSGVAIDECARHGVWLDAGELERIEAYGEAMRRQVADGAALAVPTSVVGGLDLPADLLASLRISATPPPAAG